MNPKAEGLGTLEEHKWRFQGWAGSHSGCRREQGPLGRHLQDATRGPGQGHPRVMPWGDALGVMPPPSNHDLPQEVQAPGCAFWVSEQKAAWDSQHPK